MTPDRLADADDATVLRAVAQGDELALAHLYERHAGWLLVRMRRRCASPDTVDQALQDTFLAVWRQAGRYRGQGDVSAFIWGIGIRRLIDAMRGVAGPGRRRGGPRRPRGHRRPRAGPAAPAAGRARRPDRRAAACLDGR